MNDQNPRGHNPHDDERTDNERPDSCGCTSELECFEHYEVSERNDAPTAHTDGGQTEEIAVGDQFHLEGELRTVEVATFAHEGETAVLETVDAKELREYIVPTTLIEESSAVAPA